MSTCKKKLKFDATESEHTGLPTYVVVKQHKTRMKRADPPWTAYDVSILIGTLNGIDLKTISDDWQLEGRTRVMKKFIKGLNQVRRIMQEGGGD